MESAGTAEFGSSPTSADDEAELAEEAGPGTTRRAGLLM